MADLFLGGQVDPATHERTGTNTTVDTGDFTTHGVIVGMTGSGKTGLGVILIEEALQAGVPTLLIDPKGDLTNLCLTFPELAPADFEPWVNEGDATKAGQTLADYAAAQADLWRNGLSGWGIGPERIAALREKVEFTIYTPGSQSGVPVNIVGSLQAPADTSDLETVNDEIEGYVQGLLSLVGIDADPLSSREHILLSNLIQFAWSQGQDLDLATLVGQVQTPPIRKLGVFELDQFFPPNDRTALAMRLNGLLASPSFASWAMGPAFDIDTMLRTPDGRPRCAIVTTAHLSDEERQFVTTLVLSKLVTWMRRQSGTTDLRALLYMDEVMGYLPPTQNPPTKKPIMTLMKQARAFGVGVVLSTQNPVDIDYKAISNAGTWMIGRLQTDRDKQRLLDGMSAAAGGVDIQAVGDTISGLAKREFVLRRAGKDKPDTFTTRWAMSYLRGPLTRDQIETLMADAPEKATPASDAPAAPAAAGGPSSGDQTVAADATSTAATAPTPAPTAEPTAAVPPPANATPLADDETVLMPEIATGIPVAYLDPAAPWAADLGVRTGTRHELAVVARVHLRYDEAKADLIHDEEYEAVLFPLPSLPDPAQAVAVDYDDRDLRSDAPVSIVYALPAGPVKTKAWWNDLRRSLVDHLVRSKEMEVHTNRDLKLWSRVGETLEQFTVRCRQVADDKADAETAALREKYELKVRGLQQDLREAERKVDGLEDAADDKRNEELLGTAGSILGGLLGGRRSRSAIVGSIGSKLGTAAGRRTRTSAAQDRVDAAKDKVVDVQEKLVDLEADLSQDVMDIDYEWLTKAQAITTVPVPLEKTDVKVVDLRAVWVPVG
jgi:hypothetical protein